MSAGYDAVVLAGGEARRLGGADKPGLVVGGRTLLERVAGAVSGAGRVVVVGPVRDVPGVVFTREDPPGGGPVPALRAGLREVTAPRVVLLAADLPFLAPSHVAALLAALSAAQSDPADPADPTPPPPSAKTPAPPSAKTPAPPSAETPAPPSAETPAPPSAETPAPPSAETPAPPSAETPAPPSAETPAPPAAEAPPASDVSAAPGGGVEPPAPAPVSRRAHDAPAGPGTLPGGPEAPEKARPAPGSTSPVSGDHGAAAGREEGIPGRRAGVVAVDGDGREQWLLGVWDTGTLREALGRYGGRSLRGLLAPLVAARVTLPGRAWFDCDTMDDLYEARLGDTTRVPFPTTGGGAPPGP
ncbi:NTP transferase domain-containing protein [Nonomuraea roseoviolacea]|uniref:Molybdopterin-guanine dinucleotide biosynthesis protein A n=1 Tax=Nonomuraea roseoviolacea subsp. carminata TaxID=160689 RepID=A0ABT1KB25_9ACTN|nr:NTP transferase domain-containing protein [Nonomuraea roseoviolacea]MCP2350892.1 molybdopterin-guanine dinucleotide biosynthesis protein A [Nonomuraea roseoviolacea subsp. carminata]